MPDRLSCESALKAGVPRHLIDGLREYALVHRPTGDFLRAVLENNLLMAVSYADPESLASLKEIVVFAYMMLPANCWGSPERVRAWLAKPAERATVQAAVEK